MGEIRILWLQPNFVFKQNFYNEDLHQHSMSIFF